MAVCKALVAKEGIRLDGTNVVTIVTDYPGER